MQLVDFTRMPEVFFKVAWQLVDIAEVENSFVGVRFVAKEMREGKRVVMDLRYFLVFIQVLNKHI